MQLLRRLRLWGLGASAGLIASARAPGASRYHRPPPRPRAPPASPPPRLRPRVVLSPESQRPAVVACRGPSPATAACMELPGAGLNSNECESVSSKEKMSEEFEANTMDFLVDLPFATIDIKEDSEKYILRNAGLKEAQAGIKIAGRNINNLRYADNTTLMAESEEELKSLLMKVIEESEKVDVKLNIQKMKIMASGPITSWEIDGETMETVSDFILGGSKITADGDCSHEIKRRLPLGRKVMTNLDSIFKSRDITLPTKVRLVKAMVFPMVMYGCESWTVKKAECRRIDAFELWCWRRLLRVPWTARRSNQSILKEISPGCSNTIRLYIKNTSDLKYFKGLIKTSFT